MWSFLKGTLKTDSVLELKCDEKIGGRFFFAVLNRLNKHFPKSLQSARKRVPTEKK